MKRTIYLALLTILLFSCNQSESNTNSIKLEKSNSIEGIIYNKIKYELDFNKSLPGNYRSHKLIKYRSEILGSIKVVDKVQIPKNDLLAVFYSYYVGTDLIRETQYVKKEGDHYFIFNKYYSSYDEDPFKNGEPIKGKELLKKIGDWSEGNQVSDFYGY